ncbi:discoidin domain-containing protein [Paenibacillus antri]|nr:discoidin domain-containing protein [Paenibacillus antri]
MGRMRRGAATIGLAIAAAALLAASTGCEGGRAEPAPRRAAYGTPIEGTRAAGEASEGCAAARAADNAGMSGAGAKAQLHGDEKRAMWCLDAAAGQAASLAFDLGSVQPLGEMWIWNYNEPQRTAYGLKEVAISLSVDGQTWTAWEGEGAPFVFAEASGAGAIAATNLEGGEPVRFGGALARYVRLEAHPEAGKGNRAADGTRTFGLSEVRFYRYAGEVTSGALIHPIDAVSSAPERDVTPPDAVVSHYGMSALRGADDTHDRRREGMWLATTPAGGGEEAAIVVDLGGTYPLGEMHVWNYNGGGEPGPEAGLKQVTIAYSIDKLNWTELRGEAGPYRLAKADGGDRLAATNADDGKASPIDFGGVHARYVRIAASGADGNWGAEAEDGSRRYGLSELRFFAGEGLAVEPAHDWTGLFSSYRGWTGADGVYSIPLDGRDAPGGAADGRTLFFFSDTFVGAADPIGRMRVQAGMVNNSMAALRGGEPDPASLSFLFAPKSADLSLFTPKTPNAPKGSWYWLQDGVTIDGSVYLFPLLMEKDPDGAPGFQFKTSGVHLIKLPLTEEGPLPEAQTQTETPLRYVYPDGGGEALYGAAILDLTEASGASNPDGYLYVYGYKNTPTTKRLLVARVRPESIEDFEAWRFWDGAGWSRNIADAAPLADGVSAELSVTETADGPFAGKYLLVVERDTLSHYVAYRVGDSPAGPFGPMTDVYYAPEPADFEGLDVITYNAKAHPHLSRPGELLISYNVNSTNWSAHTVDADIYRPRWVRLRSLAKEE